MKTPKILLLAAACLWSLGASAQWQWIDKDGRKVFSDRPPPADIAEKNILKQPSGAGARAVVVSPASAEDAASAAATPSGATSKAAPTGKDKELEKKKAQAEADEEAKKKAEAEKMAAAKADNCKRAQQAKAAYDSGRPVTQTNAQGERIFLDEKARAAETKRINEVIASNCSR